MYFQLLTFFLAVVATTKTPYDYPSTGTDNNPSSTSTGASIISNPTTSIIASDPSSFPEAFSLDFQGRQSKPQLINGEVVLPPTFAETHSYESSTCVSFNHDKKRYSNLLRLSFNWDKMAHLVFFLDYDCKVPLKISPIKTIFSGGEDIFQSISSRKAKSVYFIIV